MGKSLNLPLLWGGLDIHYTLPWAHLSLPPQVASVIAAGLTAVTSTEIDTQTDHCSPLVAVCCIYAVHVMPPNNNTRFGERGFSYYGPAAWNPFPSDLHDITHTGAFRK